MKVGGSKYIFSLSGVLHFKIRKNNKDTSNDSSKDSERQFVEKTTETNILITIYGIFVICDIKWSDWNWSNGLTETHVAAAPFKARIFRAISLQAGK